MRLALATRALGAALLCGCPGSGPEHLPSASRVVSTTLESGAILKAGSTFSVTADGRGVVSATFGPRQISRFAEGPDATVTFDAAEFPEGGARLALSIQQAFSEPVVIDQVWIDHSPPELLRVENAVAGAGQSIRLLLWDAVALDRAELSLGELSETRQLQRTFASAQATVVEIPTAELAEGAFDLALTLWDAAGHQSAHTVPVVIDRTPPVAQILSPAEGAQVAGMLQVEVAASDNVAVAAVTLRANGSLVAVLAGGTSTLAVDTSVFPAGPLVLEVLARDTAGNPGEVHAVIVHVQ
jgi:hypothetical protein